MQSSRLSHLIFLLSSKVLASSNHFLQGDRQVELLVLGLAGAGGAHDLLVVLGGGLLADGDELLGLAGLALGAGVDLLEGGPLALGAALDLGALNAVVGALGVARVTNGESGRTN